MLARNFQDLVKMVPVPDDLKKAPKFCSLEKLYFGLDPLIQKADDFQRINDLERSYIYRMKFILYDF